MSRLYLIIFFLLTTFLVFIPNTWAASLSITCDTSSCTTSGPTPIFNTSDDGLWYPGRVVTKTLDFKNSSASDQQLAVRALKLTGNEDLAQVMRVVIKIHGQGTNLLDKNLKDFTEADAQILTTVGAGETKEFDLTATMDINAGNEYQNKTVVFDLTFGFWGEGSDDHRGGPDNQSPDTKTCNDSKPGTPGNLKVVPGPNLDQATLSWTSPSEPYTYFVIAYSDNNSSPKWGVPDTGKVNSYTISNLTPGTYYFWLRANNNCQPGEMVGPVEITIPGNILGLTTTEFGTQILGTTTPSAQEVLTDSGDTKGAAASFCQTCLWWPMLLAEVILLALYYFLVFRWDFSRRTIVFAATIPLFTYLWFWLANRLCLKEFSWSSGTSIFCKYFLLIDLGLFLIYLGLNYLKRSGVVYEIKVVKKKRRSK